MRHYTLNTGHTRESPRAEVSDDVIAVMRPWLEPGRHILTPVGREYALVVPDGLGRGFVGTVFRGPAPLVSIGVAGDEEAAEEIWDPLEQLYLRLTDRAFAPLDWAAPRRPEAPWCAVAIVGVELEGAAGWLGDFERCLAWAWTER